MKIAIVSDTHDNLANFKKAISLIKKEKIKILIHCGDIFEPETIKEALKDFSGKAHIVLSDVDEDYFKPRSENLTTPPSVRERGNVAKQVKFLLRGKPFECVGTKKESLVAFYLALRSFMRRRVRRKLPTLLDYFQNKILLKYPKLEKDSIKILNSWNKQHNLPRNFEEILKNHLKGLNLTRLSNKL